MSMRREQLIDYKVVGLPENYASLDPVRFTLVEANPIPGKPLDKAECEARGWAAEKMKRLKLTNGSRIEVAAVSSKYYRDDSFHTILNVQDMSIIGFAKEKTATIDDGNELPF